MRSAWCRKNIFHHDTTTVLSGKKSWKVFFCRLILSWKWRRKSCSRIELMVFGVVGGTLECFCMKMWMRRTIRKFIIALIWIILEFVWIGKNESIPARRFKWSERKLRRRRVCYAHIYEEILWGYRQPYSLILWWRAHINACLSLTYFHTLPW